MTTAQATWLGELQGLLTNTLDLEALRGKRLAGILGDVPSTYAKSPRLWNAAFQALGLEAVYVPLDVPQERLRDVLHLLRSSERFLGGSVTVPYKMQVIPLLDDVDPLAARIGAVNVIARRADGRLIGYNTDGLGALRSLTVPMLPGPRPRIPALAQARVLLLGAGGAAQALAFYLWDAMRQGELVVANRTRSGTEALVKRLSAMRPGHLAAVTDEAVAEQAARMDLLINATVKGQAGIRKLPDGRWTCLEPYSALAPASPAALPPMPGDESAFFEAWSRQSLDDIRRNQDASWAICAKLPRASVCYDIIYAPLETAFLRQARWSGHPTLNGKEMNLIQAVEAFMRYVCGDWLVQLGLDGSQTYPQVAQAMAAAWAR